MRTSARMRAARLALAMLAVWSTGAGLNDTARAAPNDYGYGAQAAPPPGEPIDLLGVLAPVRKVAPGSLARPAAPGASAEPRAPSRKPEAAPETPRPAPPPATSPADASLTSAPLPPQARPDWLEMERAGAPYEAKGRWYVPTPDPGYSETGLAVALAQRAAGAPTASGEPFAPEAILAAHPTLPLPSLVQVTNLDTGREIIARLVDRGPFEGRGLLALTGPALFALGADAAGARVHVRYLGPAPRRVGADISEPRRTASAPSQISAPATAPALTGDRFVVQVGAFGDPQAAERVRRTVAAVAPATTDARNGLHRVRLGPVASRDDAERLRRSVAALGFSTALIAPLR